MGSNVNSEMLAAVDGERVLTFFSLVLDAESDASGGGGV